MTTITPEDIALLCEQGVAIKFTDVAKSPLEVVLPDSIRMVDQAKVFDVVAKIGQLYLESRGIQATGYQVREGDAVNGPLTSAMTFDKNKVH